MKTTKTSENNKLIIGFAGRKRCGKGLLSTGLKEWFENNTDRPVQIVTIASYLKKLCCELIGVPTIEKLNDIKDRGVELNIQIPVDEWADRLHERSDIDRDILVKELTKKGTILDARELLQYVGTDVFRKYYAGWHIDQAVKDIKAAPNNAVVLVDDVRFPNEKEGIEALGGEIYFIARPSCFAISNHASETSLSWNDFLPNNILVNNKTAEEFVDVAIRHIAKRERVDSDQIVSNRPIIPVVWSYNQRQLTEEDTLDRIIRRVKEQMKSEYTDGTLFLPMDEATAADFKIILAAICMAEPVEGGYLITNPLVIETLKARF